MLGGEGQRGKSQDNGHSIINKVQFKKMQKIINKKERGSKDGKNYKMNWR